MGGPGKAPRGSAPRDAQPDQRRGHDTAPTVSAAAAWVKELAASDLSRGAYRVALALLGEDGAPRTPKALRRELGISRSTMTRALQELGERVVRSGRSIALPSDAAAADRRLVVLLRGVLADAGLERVARAWLPDWLRNQCPRLRELAHLDRADLLAGARALSERIEQKAAEGVALRRDYALEEWIDRSVALGGRPASVAVPAPASAARRFNGATQALVALVAVAPDRWDRAHCARVADAAGLPEAEADHLLAARDAWAEELGAAEWRRLAPKRTLEYLEQRRGPHG